MKKTPLFAALLGLFLAAPGWTQEKVLQKAAQAAQAKAKDLSVKLFEKLLKEKDRIISEARRTAKDRNSFYKILREGLGAWEKKLAEFVKKFPKSPKVLDALSERVGILGFLGKKEEVAKLVEKMKELASSVKDFKAVALAVARQKGSAQAGKAFLETIAKTVTDDKEKKAGLLLATTMFADPRDKETLEATLKKIVEEFPGTKAARTAENRLRALNLAEGQPPLDLSQFKDIDGKPIKMEDYKGKVLLIDFWATWCGPCMHELPNVLEAYKKYHDKGFEILGISFDTDREKFEKVIKEKGMTWRHYFDGKGWGNEIGALYNVRAIPHTILVGRDGKIAAINIRGERLIEMVRELVEGEKSGDK